MQLAELGSARGASAAGSTSRSSPCRAATAPARRRPARSRSCRRGAPLPRRRRPPRTRVAYAAAHVVADPLAGGSRTGPPGSTGRPRSPTAATCGSTASASPRRWTPPSAAWASTGRRRRSSSAARSPRRAPPAARSPAAPAPTTCRRAGVARRDRRAYEEQCAFVEGEGAPVILMASRALAAAAKQRRRLPRALRALLAGLERPGGPALARRHVRPRARRLLGPERPRRGDRLVLSISRRTPTRSRGSRSRCSTTRARSRCAAACPRACGCTPATTSTTRR